jgi:hypothetical protein
MARTGDAGSYEKRGIAKKTMRNIMLEADRPALAEAAQRNGVSDVAKNSWSIFTFSG